MDRDEAEDYVYASYMRAEPHLDRDAPDSEKRDPSLTRDVLRSLSGTPSVIVTGSKGKGSVAYMISEILRGRYRTGLMTGPHITRFNERIGIDGECIGDDDLVRCTERVRGLFDPIESVLPEDRYISPVGIQAAIACMYFRDMGTEYNIFECGKGARYDDVPNILHDYTIINTVFAEHTRELGGTVEAIADDKSYAVTGSERCVFIAEQEPSVMEVLLKRTASLGVRTMVYGRDFRASDIRYSDEGMTFDVTVGGRIFNDITIPLLGEHQARNFALAAAVCLEIDDTLNIGSMTDLSWPGRLELLRKGPTVILDACINRRSCADILQVVRRMCSMRPNTVVCIPDDKDYIGVCTEMSKISERMILTSSGDPHYRFTSGQIEVLKEHGIEAEWYDSPYDAVSGSFDGERPVILLGTTSFISRVKTARMTDIIMQR